MDSLISQENSDIEILEKTKEKNEDTLPYWINIYFATQVQGRSQNTIKAKRADLGMFLSFFYNTLLSYNIDLWTPSISRSFQTHLLTTKSKNGETFKASSVNRVMSSIKHLSNWINKKRGFKAGSPFEQVKIIDLDEPKWNGLTDNQITRLKGACDIRLKAKARDHQNPLRETAVFYILLYTGLRAAELASLNYEQYHHRGFHNVVRSKSHRISTKVPLPSDAAKYLDLYLEDRKLKAGLSPQEPLITTRYGNRISTTDIYRICERIGKQANVFLPEGSRFHITPHMLRHTFLRRVADKHDVHVAQKMSGSVSIKEIFRYTQPSQAEVDNFAEEIFGG